VELAEYIRREALDVQKKADADITEEELEIFYSVLEMLYGNFQNITKERENNIPSAPAD
jgi:hypothetical protein